MDCNRWLPESWPNETRLWFYAIENALQEEQQTEILERGALFLEGWTAHGQALSASWVLADPQVLILGVFPGALPSGCSLDKVSAFIQEAERDFKMDFRNRKRLVLVQERAVVVGEPPELVPELELGLGWLNMYAPTARLFREKPLLERETPWINRMFTAVSVAKLP
jgi:hypothetical protein